ncbi:MAG TPA: hypothetical protein VIX80_09040 [Candidatus Kapabacteria bacterium]
MKTLAKVFFVCVACLSANLFIGCSEDPVDDTPKRVIPKSGSSYTYVRSERANADPFATVSGTDTVHTVTSQADIRTFAGKDSVVTFVDVNTMNTSATPDTMTIAYEANGDISIYRGNGFEGLPPGTGIEIPTWWKLPFKSKTDIVIINEAVGISIDVFTVDSVKGIAKGYSTTVNYTLNGKTYACEQADVTFTAYGRITSPFTIPLTLVFKTTYLFNEEIGYFVSFDTQNNIPQLAWSLIDPDNNIQVLTSFDVKK